MSFVLVLPGVDLRRRAMMRHALRSAASLAVLPLAGGYAMAATETITIDNFSFSPASLAVKAGTIVTWENHDDIPHSVVQAGGGFRSKALDTDDRYSLTFDKPGSFDYFCGLHPHMKARITVLP